MDIYKAHLLNISHKKHSYRQDHDIFILKIKLMGAILFVPSGQKEWR